jgi:hypothetical protein
MNPILLGLLILLSKPLFAEIATKNAVFLSDSHPSYFSIINPENIKLLNDPNFINSTFPTMEEIARKACDYDIKPQSITISVGIISVTWEIDKLCV